MTHWPERMPARSDVPGFREALTIVGMVAVIALADYITRLPDMNAAQCGSDEDCVQYCIGQGKPHEHCLDVLGPSDDDDARHVRI